MMSETHNEPSNSPMRKLVLSLIIGGVFGFLTIYGVSHLLSYETFAALSKSARSAVLVGAFFILMGVGVGLGAMLPSVGAKVLNVEDVEELREQRPMLLASGVSLPLWGIALIVLALAAPEGPVPEMFALVVSVGAMLVGSYFAWLSYRVSDELMLALNHEGTAISFVLTFVVIGGWAVAQHLGYAVAMGPLDILTLFYVLTLAASFVAAGRRGLLKPR